MLKIILKVLLAVTAVVIVGNIVLEKIIRTEKTIQKGQIQISGSGVKVDVAKIRVQRNSRGDVRVPSTTGKIIATRDIKSGESVSVNIDLTGITSRSRDSGFRTIVGIDKGGSFIALGRVLDVGPVRFEFGAGANKSSVLGLLGVGFGLLGEHSEVILAYTTNQSVALGLAFKF